MWPMSPPSGKRQTVHLAQETKSVLTRNHTSKAEHIVKIGLNILEALWLPGV